MSDIVTKVVFVNQTEKPSHVQWYVSSTRPNQIWCFLDDSMFWRQRVDKEQRMKARFVILLQPSKALCRFAQTRALETAVAEPMMTQQGAQGAPGQPQGWWYSDPNTGTPVLVTGSEPPATYPATGSPQRSRPSSKAASRHHRHKSSSSASTSTSTSIITNHHHTSSS